MDMSLIRTLSAAALLMALPAVAGAQGVDIGKSEFQNNCAACHGLDGKGNGPMAGLLSKSVPNLSLLQKNNGGVFPFARVYDVIDGRQDVPSHGTRDMPVWGKEYNAEAGSQLGYLYTNADAESFIRGRILALIGHIATLQEK